MITKSRTEAAKFVSDIIWVAIAQLFVSLLLVFVTMPALTKTYTSEIYGIWMQVNVTVNLLVPLLSLQFGTTIVRFLAESANTDDRRRVFGTLLWPVVILACLVFIISLLFKQELSMLLFNSLEYVSYVPLTFLWAGIGSIYIVGLSYMRASGKIKKLMIILVSFAVSKILVIITLVTTGHSLGWIIGSAVACEAITTALITWMIVREIGWPTFDRDKVKDYLTFSVPQIPGGVFTWIISLSDRYFITHIINLSQAGIYSVSWALGNTLILFCQPIAFVLLPTLSKYWDQTDKVKVINYLDYSNKLFLALAIPAAGGLFILSQPLLRIFSTAEYMVGGTLVLLIAIGTILNGLYQINVYIILLIKQTKWLPLLIGIAGTINIGLNLVLIPASGILGAAISTVAAYSFLAIIVAIWERKIMGYRMDFVFLAKVIFGTLLMIISLSFFQINSVMSILIAIIAGITIFCLGLVVMRSFSRRDWQLTREILGGLVDMLRKKQVS